MEVASKKSACCNGQATSTKATLMATPGRRERELNAEVKQIGRKKYAATAPDRNVTHCRFLKELQR